MKNGVPSLSAERALVIRICAFFVAVNREPLGGKKEANFRIRASGKRLQRGRGFLVPDPGHRLWLCHADLSLFR